MARHGAAVLKHAVCRPEGVICPWNAPSLLMTWKVG